MVPGRLGGGLGAGEVRSPDEDGHMAGVFGEEDALLRGGKAAPHHKDLLVGEELPVAGGAVGHPPAPEGLLPLEAHHPGMGPGGPEDAEAGQVPPAGADGFHIPRQVQAGDLRQEELRPEGLGLLAHGLGELGAAGVGHTGVVHHLLGDGDLAAEVLLLHHQHPVPGPGQVEPGGEARRAAPDDDDVVESALVHHSCPTRSRLGFRVSAPGCHLAGQTSSPCSWTNWRAWTFRSSSSALRPTLPALTS